MTMRDIERYIGVAEYDSSIAIATTIAKTALISRTCLNTTASRSSRCTSGTMSSSEPPVPGVRSGDGAGLNWRELDSVALSEPRAGRLAAVAHRCHAYRGCGGDRRRRRIREEPFVPPARGGKP